MTAKTTTTNTFMEIVNNYEDYADMKATTPHIMTSADKSAYDTALVTLSTAIAYSVLKKCINVSEDKALKAVRASLTRDIKALEMTAYTADTAHKATYTADGDYTVETVDTDLHRRFNELTAMTIGDGMDIMHTALVSIIEETNKAKERNGGYLCDTFMTTPYTVRRLKRKVWIKTAESVNGWETVETTPLREVYKEVRRYIESQRAVKVGANGYTYLEDIAHDTDTDMDTVIYRRFGKYADIGGEVTDFNGKVTAYTADKSSVDKVDKILSSLNLTTKQMKVLSLRQSGYGYKAIATYLGVTQRAVAKTCKAIQDKAIKAGYTLHTADTDTDTENN